MNKRIAFFFFSSLLTSSVLCSASTEPASSTQSVYKKVNRDPTRPLKWTTPQSVSEKWVLQAVFVNGEASRAVLNNQSVSVGDELNGWTVRDIKRSGVTLVSPKGTKWVQLRKSLNINAGS